MFIVFKQQLTMVGKFSYCALFCINLTCLTNRFRLLVTLMTSPERLEVGAVSSRR